VVENTMSETTRERIMESVADFTRFSKSLNDLVFLSVTGKCPQPLKMGLLRYLCNEYFQSYFQKHPEKEAVLDETVQGLMTLSGMKMENHQGEGAIQKKKEELGI
jgi:hypothetical protein